MSNSIVPPAVWVASLIGLLAWSPCTTAQTCASHVPATTTHLQSNGNGTVSDPLTGLMWKQCSEGQTGNDCAGSALHYTWRTALEAAVKLNSSGGFAGYTDWRLPNVKELRALLERQCYQPAIRADAFPNTPSAWFWSSSPYAKAANQAWGIGFDGGYDSVNGKNAQARLRLVRGG